MKSKSIKLMYWKDVTNIGDLLSPYIMERFTDKSNELTKAQKQSPNYLI